jgi:hypothetical protein
MKLLLALLVVAGFLVGSVKTEDKSIDDLKIKVLQVSPSGNVTVEINNSSSGPIKIWKDSNSWGAARWRVCVISKGRLEIFFQNPNQDFTRNFPAFIQLAPGSGSKQILDLNGGNWCGRGRCTLYSEHRSREERISFEAGDVLVVSYDVPATIEACRMGVWYGVAGALTTFK